MIVYPPGEILAGPLCEEEKILSAELEMEEMHEGKFDLESVRHNSRPESKFYLPF
jgi:nitrilase